MDQSGQEGSGREDDCVRLEDQPDLRDRAGHAVALHEQVVDRLLEQRQVRLGFEAPADRRLVKDAIGLRAGCAHGRTLARVQRPELDPGLVGGDRHRPAERVHLLDEVALADAPDRGVAGHLAERLDAVRQQQRLAAHPCGGERCLGAGVATADDDDLEAIREFHEINDLLLRTQPANDVAFYAKPAIRPTGRFHVEHRHPATRALDVPRGTQRRGRWLEWRPKSLRPTR